MDDDTMRGRFQKALDLGSNVHDLTDIRDGIKSGEMQGFMGDGAFIVTQIATWPRKKILNLMYLAGELEPVLGMQPELERFAREHGCAEMTAFGRPGWQRVLPKRGWKHTASVFTWDLGG